MLRQGGRSPVAGPPRPPAPAKCHLWGPDACIGAAEGAGAAVLGRLAVDPETLVLSGSTGGLGLQWFKFLPRFKAGFPFVSQPRTRCAEEAVIPHPWLRSVEAKACDGDKPSQLKVGCGDPTGPRLRRGAPGRLRPLSILLWISAQALASGL